jgi:phage shock protein C
LFFIKVESLIMVMSSKKESIMDKKKNKNSTAKKKKVVNIKKDNNVNSKINKTKKLYRSNEDKMISGVCGGIAEYLDIDAIWVRLVFIITTFTSGVGLIAYIIFWILVPENPNQKSIEKTVSEKRVNEFSEKIKNRNIDSSNGRYLGGLILIAIGGIFLFEEFFWKISWNYIWPVLLIGLGIHILVKKGE